VTQEVRDVREVQVSGVRASGGRASGGRHATHGRYRGRHRRPNRPVRLQAGVRLALTAGCAALLVCLPQPSWAGRMSTVAAHSAAASQAIVKNLPTPFNQRQHA
jgi:hypothetical protein